MADVEAELAERLAKADHALLVGQISEVNAEIAKLMGRRLGLVAMLSNGATRDANGLAFFDEIDQRWRCTRCGDALNAEGECDCPTPY